VKRHPLVVYRKRRDVNEERRFVYPKHRLLHGECLVGTLSSHLLDLARLVGTFLHHLLDGERLYR
jgi:hypothetical protein